MRLSRVRSFRTGAFRSGACAAALWLGACASPGMPPGGPPDVAAPALQSVSPDSGAVRVRASSVTLRFDEVLSERTSGGGGGAGAIGTLDALILLSPGDGNERVRWRRTALEIEPRGGFRANTTYRLTLLPGLVDLRGNILRESHAVVFTTGDSLTSGEITGAIFDWAAGRAAPLARIEAFTGADSTFRWVTRADSSGRFALRDLRADTYHVRAWIDQTPNRVLDRREAFDSLTVTLNGRATNDFYVFGHDTIGPRIETVTPVDSTALRIRFDQAVGLAWTPDSLAVVLQSADSTRVAVRTPMTAARFDSLTTASRAAADSADTTRTAPRPVAARSQVTPARPAADTLRPGPAFGRRIPAQEWIVPLVAPLMPGEFRLRALDVEGLAGARQSSERVFRVREPAPPAPRDSTAAPAPRPPRP